MAVRPGPHRGIALPPGGVSPGGKAIRKHPHNAQMGCDHDRFPSVVNRRTGQKTESDQLSVQASLAYPIGDFGMGVAY